MPTRIDDLFVAVVLPVLAITGVGALVQRVKPLSVETLVRLNLYVFVPAFLFDRVSSATLSWLEIGKIGVAVLAPMAILGAALFAVMRSARAAGGTIAAAVVGSLFFNAGNFGIPVAQLAYGDPGGAVQSLVVMFMNTAIFFIGYAVIAASKGGGFFRGALGYFKLPMFYAIAAGLAVRDLNLSIPAWIDESVSTLSVGMVPVALLTLGAQLSLRARRPRWGLIAPVMLLKLVALPAVTAIAVWSLGLWPWPGAMLILASAAPTAINTLLLTVELDGDAGSAADCVFWTTLASAGTVTIVLVILESFGGGPRG